MGAGRPGLTMSQVEVTKLQRAGTGLKQAGKVAIQTRDIVAQAETGDCSVLYLRSGEKLLVQEGLDQIERQKHASETQHEIVKLFKRRMRICKGQSMPVDEAFGAVWQETSAELKLDHEEQAKLFQELLDWTKRWLK